MKFIKVRSHEQVANDISSKINKRLDTGKTVFWLAPGGSSIEIAIKASKLITQKNRDKLTVTLSDERFGPVGHKDSNWKQLEDGGFDLPGAKLEPVLINRSLPETESHFDKILDTAKNANYKLGFIGLGADSHCAGIKPNSPAVFSKQNAVGYQGADFVRLTITAKYIDLLDEVITYAVGAEKHHVFEELAQDISIIQAPVQVLKHVPSWTIYNDFMETK